MTFSDNFGVSRSSLRWLANVSGILVRRILHRHGGLEPVEFEVDDLESQIFVPEGGSNEEDDILYLVQLFRVALSTLDTMFNIIESLDEENIVE